MPGTKIAVSTRSGPASAPVIPAEACLHIAALSERGPTVYSPDPQGRTYAECTSYADFLAQCGDPQPYGWAAHTARTFFNDGGVLLRVARVVGAARTKGTLNLLDRAGVPVATLRVDAVSAGAWSSRVTVQIVNGLLANTFDLLVLYDGVQAEAFRGLATPAAAAAAVTGTSRFVNVTALADATAAPNNNPAVAGPTALSAGNDDRASVVPADYVNALNTAFPPELGSGVVAIPGFTVAQIGAGLLAHCQATNRNGYLSGNDVDEASAKASAATLLGPGGEYLRYLTPWVTYTDETGTNYTVPPEGFAAAGRCKAILSAGVWRADAGAITRSQFLTGVARVIGGAEGGRLDDAHVTVIRMISGRPEVYGMRSLSLDDNWALFKHRDLVNKIATDLPALLSDVEFGTVDARGRFAARVAAIFKAYLAPIATAGGLFPKYDDVDPSVQIDPGYSIDTSATVNTPQLIAQRKFAVLTVIRPSESANEIDVMLVKAAINASV
jgi:hypothetical protein